MKIKYFATLTFFNFVFLQTSEQLNQDLMKAALDGQLETVKCLVEQRADVNAKDNTGWTVLMFATFNGNTKIVKYLAEHGADINAKNNAGFTALDFAPKDTAHYLKQSIILHRYLKGSLARCPLDQEPNLAHYVARLSQNNELSIEQQLDNAREAFEIDQDSYWRAQLQDAYFHWQEKEQTLPITRLLTEIDSGRLLQIIGYFNNRIEIVSKAFYLMQRANKKKDLTKYCKQNEA